MLMGFAEALPAPEVFFSLRSAGIAVRVFCRRGSRASLVRKLPVGQPIEITAPEDDIEAAARELGSAIAELAGTSAPDLMVLGLDDPGLWLVDRVFAAGMPEGVRAVNPLGAPAEVALDKVAQVAVAREAGLTVPQTVVASTHDDVRAAAIPGASIVKPAHAVRLVGGRLGKGRAHFFRTPEERAALSDDLDLAFPILIQPLIAGVGEGIFGFVGAGGVTGWSAHRRLRMVNPHGSGASACESQPPDTHLCDRVAEMMTAIGWRGPFMVELLKAADGTSYFVELNGRLWGSMALARRGGFEYPAWAVHQTCEAAFMPPAVPAAPDRIAVRHLGRDLVHLMHVLRGPKSDFHRAGWPRFWPSLAAVMRPGPGAGFYNYDPAFPRFFLQDAWSTVLGQLRRR